MQAYRIQQAALLSYDDSAYKYAPLNWTQHNPIQPQAMAHDRYFYDGTTGTYTVDKYLADVRTRYGGIDSILIWPTYPNMGVDSRNQDQLIRDMPGFPNGVKQMIADFHRNGVKVLFPYNPWDIGTHDPGGAWSEVLPKTMAEIGVDGMNGDTLTTVDNEFFQNSLIDKRPLALEPELGRRDRPLFRWLWNSSPRFSFRFRGDSMEHHGLGILPNPVYFVTGKPA
jgi:gamma-glutamyl hercynylcysteine S-oxide synthase